MSFDPDDPIRPQLKVIQIINVALALGLIMFLAVSVFLRISGKDGLFGEQPTALASPLAMAAIGLTVVWVVAAALVPGLMVQNARRAIAAGTWRPYQGENPQHAAPPPQTDAGKFLLVYQTQRIIRLALLEAAGFFNLIVFMLEGNALTLVVAVGLIAGQFVGFPTRFGLENWVEQQIELMRTEP